MSGRQLQLLITLLLIFILTVICISKPLCISKVTTVFHKPQMNGFKRRWGAVSCRERTSSKPGPERGKAMGLPGGVHLFKGASAAKPSGACLCAGCALWPVFPSPAVWCVEDCAPHHRCACGTCVCWARFPTPVTSQTAGQSL